ncbi:type II toxin-antitoxin system PemK/MazF family toxin [Modestobacter sp. NPDC049651]|uniref:type II toxin-antitoxin system PemK/MazF family toxin n=1 Tax=unclassified Modestobacter TaxID=2643866 RepID=UPI003401EAA8
MARSNWQSVVRQVVRVVIEAGRRPADPTPRQARPDRAPRSTRAARRAPAPTPASAPVEIDYAPRDDGRPDPGEIVWAWVPFEEGDGRGKDRPVLVVGREGATLLALMLSSKDHDLDAADEARHGRSWIDIGTGGWDRQGRPSEVRVDRVLRLDPGAVRREGAVLDRARFREVAAEVRRVHGW